MKSINTYIIEKLNLNKDIVINRYQDFNKGDKLFCVSIEFLLNEYTVKLYDPFTLRGIEGNSIKYNTRYPRDDENGKNLSHIFDINSNGYYEMKKSGTTALYMTPDDGINFLEDISKHDITPKLLFKYFDADDEFLNDNPIKEDFSQRRIEQLIEKFSN